MTTTPATAHFEKEILSNPGLSDEDRGQAIEDLRKPPPGSIDGMDDRESINVGTRTLYHRETGMAVDVLVSMYSGMLTWHHSSNHPTLAGQQVFSVKPIPGKAPRVGTIRCLLHPEHPRHADLQEWGMPVCVVNTLPNPAELFRHMRAFHPTAWAEIQDYFPELAQLKRAIPPDEEPIPASSGGSEE